MNASPSLRPITYIRPPDSVMEQLMQSYIYILSLHWSARPSLEPTRCHGSVIVFSTGEPSKAFSSTFACSWIQINTREDNQQRASYSLSRLSFADGPLLMESYLIRGSWRGWSTWISPGQVDSCNNSYDQFSGYAHLSHNHKVVIKGLHDLRDHGYRHVGKHTRLSVSHVSHIDLGWTSAHISAFQWCKQAIIRRRTRTHRNESKQPCIYTDASYSRCSRNIT